MQLGEIRGTDSSKRHPCYITWNEQSSQIYLLLLTIMYLNKDVGGKRNWVICCSYSVLSLLAIAGYNSFPPIVVDIHHVVSCLDEFFIEKESM